MCSESSNLNILLRLFWIVEYRAGARTVCESDTAVASKIAHLGALQRCLLVHHVQEGRLVRLLERGESDWGHKAPINRSGPGGALGGGAP